MNMGENTQQEEVICLRRATPIDKPEKIRNFLGRNPQIP